MTPGKVKRVLVYISGGSPDEKERAAADRHDPEHNRVSFRNGLYWEGEIERADLVVTSLPGIAAAYKEAGVRAEPLVEPQFRPPKKTEPPGPPLALPKRRRGRPRKKKEE